MDMPKRLVLSHEDRVSPTWKKITAHLEAKLERARLSLEGPLDAVDTARVRGRIEEIRAVLRLADDPPKTE